MSMSMPQPARRPTLPDLVVQVSTDGNSARPTPPHRHQQSHSFDEHYLGSKERQDFHQFELRLKAVNNKLRDISSPIKQLRNSANMLSCIDGLQLQLSRLRDILRANMVELSASGTERGSGFLTPLRLSSKQPQNLRRHLLPLLGGAAQHTLSVLSRFKEYSSFAGEAEIAEEVQTTMRDFANDLWYLQDCLKRRDIDLNDRVIKRYVHGLIVNVGGLGQHLIDVHAALERFHQVVEQVPKHLETRQRKRIDHLQSLSTVATLFSGVTATTLQFSYNSNASRLLSAVNFFWFTSLVLSIAAAVNSLQAITWQQAQYAQVPHWVFYWVRGAPLVFLVFSVAFYSIGLAIFAYATEQRIYTSIVTSGFTAISGIGLITVSLWFLFARWDSISASAPDNKWIMSYGIVRRFLAQDVGAGIERFANVVAQRSSDERRLQRRLYVLQSFTLAVQRQEELKLGLQHPPSPTEYSSFPIDPYPPSLGISTEYFSTDRLKTVDQLRQLKVTKSIRAHMKLICGFGFSPDGSYLTTASTDQTVVIIPLLNWGNDLSLTILPHPSDVVRQVVWSPNGKIILVRLMKGYKIWSKEGQAKNLIPREREVSSVHWLPGGEAFLSVEGNEVVKLDINGKELDVYRFSKHILRDVALVANSQRLIAVGESSESPHGLKPIRIPKEKCIIVYDMVRRKPLRQIMILGDVRSVQVSQDGRYALVSFMDKACPQLWRIDPQDTNPSIEALDDNKSNASCYSLGGAETTEGHPTGGDDITLTRSKPRDNLIAHVRTFAPESPARSVGTSYFLGDYDQLVSCADKNGFIHVWHRDTGQTLHRFQPQRGGGTLTSISWGPSSIGAFTLVTGTSEGCVSVLAESSHEREEDRPGVSIPETVSVFTPYSRNTEADEKSPQRAPRRRGSRIRDSVTQWMG